MNLIAASSNPTVPSHPTAPRASSHTNFEVPCMRIVSITYLEKLQQIAMSFEAKLQKHTRLKVKKAAMNRDRTETRRQI
jgi:hypothetical protein